MEVIESNTRSIKRMMAEHCRLTIEYVRESEGGATDEEVLALLKMTTKYLAESIEART